MKEMLTETEIFKNSLWGFEQKNDYIKLNIKMKYKLIVNIAV
jgi:hypothetical protein